MKRMWSFTEDGDYIEVLIGDGVIEARGTRSDGAFTGMLCVPTADQWQEIIDAAAIERDKAQEREERKGG